MMTAGFAGGDIVVQWSRPYTLAGIVITGYLIQITAIDGLANYVDFPNASIHNGSCRDYQICVLAKTAAGLGEAACFNKTRSGGTEKESNV